VEAAVAGGAALLAVCGGYQLLARGYRGRDGSWLEGVGLFPHETLAGDTRMIGDVLLESALPEARGRTIAGFESHAGRTLLDPGAEPLGRVVAGYGNDGESGFEGCRVGRALGTYLHGPLLPRNPWVADLLLSWAIAHATGAEPQPLAPLDDSLEREAHAVAAARARARGGRPA
jgi:CobQ-like glutamine amidotransferase family enzyme